MATALGNNVFLSKSILLEKIGELSSEVVKRLPRAGISAQMLAVCRAKNLVPDDRIVLAEEKLFNTFIRAPPPQHAWLLFQLRSSAQPYAGRPKGAIVS